MDQIQNLIQSVMHLIPGSNIRQFGSIIAGIYSVSSGGVTQLNISRYGNVSYRSVARFMSNVIPWHRVLVSVVNSHLSGHSGPYFLAIDETVEDKSGESTSKIGYFFCSKAKRAIKSVKFSTLSLIPANERKSYVVDMEQMEQDKELAAANRELKAAAAAKKQKARKEKAGKGKSGEKPEAEKAKGGRPKGSKGKAKEKSASKSYVALEAMLDRVLPLLHLSGIFPAYLVGDGAYGNMTGCLIAAERGMRLISKLHCNSALYHRPEKGSKKRKYGNRVDLSDMDRHRICEKRQKGCTITYFQINCVRTEHIDSWLNVTFMRCRFANGKKDAWVLLFSTDLGLEGMAMADYYSLRFQIEFNFRDAKEHFGMSDFKSTKPTQVTNAVGMSFLMVNLSHVLIAQTKGALGADFLSIQDLKSYFRGVFYAEKLKNSPNFAVPGILDPKAIAFGALFGGVNWGISRGKDKKAA